MRKGFSPVIVIVIVLIVAAVAGLYFFRENSATNNMQRDDVMMEGDGDPSTSLGMTEQVQYMMYNKEKYEEIVNGRHVLFFYANWCPTCRPADAQFQARMKEIPEGLAVVRVNYNDSETDADEEALAEKYGITYQHTFVLLENGQEVTRWNGGGLDELLSQIN